MSSEKYVYYKLTTQNVTNTFKRRLYILKARLINRFMSQTEKVNNQYFRTIWF